MFKMFEDKEIVVKIVRAVFLYMVKIAIGCLLNGLVIKFLWAWFIVPIGLPVISFAHAVGIGVIVALFIEQFILEAAQGEGVREEPSESLIIVKAILKIAVPIYVLGLGWLVHLFL